MREDRGSIPRRYNSFNNFVCCVVDCRKRFHFCEFLAQYGGGWAYRVA